MKSRTRIAKVKSPKRRSAPNTVNGTVPPRRVKNTKLRPREYLTVKEVGKLIDGARERGRYGHRDATMILVGYRHGLRVSELCALRWDQVDFERGMLHVRRVKNGTPSVHPLSGSEIRALRRLRGEQTESRHVFLTERRSPMSPAGFRKLIARTGEGSRFPFPVHPHMLRHACGYKLETMDRIRARCSIILDTKIFSTPCATPNCRRSGSSPFGRTDVRLWRHSGKHMLIPRLTGFDPSRSAPGSWQRIRR
jgi:integrase